MTIRQHLCHLSCLSNLQSILERSLCVDGDAKYLNLDLQALAEREKVRRVNNLPTATRRQSTKTCDDLHKPIIPILSSTQITRDSGSCPGKWIAAGYTGEGMVHAWLSGKALVKMILGGESEHELSEWPFPEVMQVTHSRWKRARRENL